MYRSAASALAPVWTPFDVPALDCVYKLQEYAGLPCRKRSTGKVNWPRRKQVWRRHDGDGRLVQISASLEQLAAAVGRKVGLSDVRA